MKINFSIILIFILFITCKERKATKEKIIINDSIYVDKIFDKGYIIQENEYLNNKIHKKGFYHENEIDSVVIFNDSNNISYSIITLIEGSNKFYSHKEFIQEKLVFQAINYKNKEGIFVPIEWTEKYDFNNPAKVKEKKYYWFINNDIIDCVGYEYYNNDGKLVRSKSHTFEFIFNDSYLNIRLISCCVNTKKIYLIHSDGSIDEIISDEFNQWKKIPFKKYLTENNNESSIEGFILIDDIKAFQNKKINLSFLNDSISSFRIYY